MKVDNGNGTIITRDHPHEIIAPGILRFDEIRWWIRELMTNPDYGWSDKGVSGLGRAMGYAEKWSLPSKLRGRWIWPREQIRLTARIREIREGYIVPRRFGQRTEGVWADPPQPPVLRAARPLNVRLHATIGGLKMVPTDRKPGPSLPQFGEAFKNVREWRG
jgi:hypothetical protein